MTEHLLSVNFSYAVKGGGHGMQGLPRRYTMPDATVCKAQGYGMRNIPELGHKNIGKKQAQ